MMIQIGLGIASRPTGQLRAQPSYGLTVSVSADGTEIPVKVAALTLEVGDSAAHAGKHLLDTGLLAKGPVCLVAPVIRAGKDGSVIESEPGLWACDASAGTTTVTRQWLADGTMLQGETGPTLAWRSSLAGRALSLVETARQNASNSLQASKAAVFAGPPAPVVPPVPPVQAELSVLPDATMQISVAPGERVRFTVTEPAAFKGSYDIASADLGAGPVWIAAPRIGGVGVAGQVLTLVHAGLCVGDAAAAPMATTGQWYRGNTPIAGATGTTHTVTAADQGHSLTWRQTATDGNGSRTVSSAEIAVVTPGALPDTFTAPDGTLLKDYKGESGLGWGSENYAVVENGHLRNKSDYAAHRAQSRLGSLGANQFAEGDMVMGSGTAGTGLAVRIQDKANAYTFRASSGAMHVFKMVNDGETSLSGNLGSRPAAGASFKARLEVQGSTLRLFIDGTQVWTGTDTAYTTGQAGICAANTVAKRDGSHITTFHAGNL